MSSSIDRSIKIDGHTVKNRILMPPLVCFDWGDSEGFETHPRAPHYGRRAAGGTGLIVVEASAVSPEGRLAETQLGLWRDEHIPQFQRIAERCHQNNSVVIVQIVHAGLKAPGKRVYSSSPAELQGKECLEMTADHIARVKEDFLSAALRAKQAGLDGVEIHGAHGYLINQFTAGDVNKRTDGYGGSLDNRLRLPLEIVGEIKEAAGKDFIIGYRFGVNDPTLQEDKYLAGKLEAAGVHMLNVSRGIGADAIEVPGDFPFSKITYLGVALHKSVSIPVACVYGIKKPEQAEYLLANDMVDMVAVGRGLLADPQWTNKAIAGQEVDLCHTCAKCKYRGDGTECPWYQE